MYSVPKNISVDLTTISSSFIWNATEKFPAYPIRSGKTKSSIKLPLNDVLS
jgi:hypothetical protein